jgi:hypothetical protein
LKANIDRQWYKRVLDFINPLRDPSLTVAAVLTFIEEAGQHDMWYWIIVIGLVNWVAVRGIVWLIVNFTFASTFLSRRVWWAIKHPRLAWRILDAVGHEEIIIGGLTSDMLTLADGTTITQSMLNASGIQIIGEIPAGTEVPMLQMPDGQAAPNFSALTGALYSGNMSGALGMYGNGAAAGGFPQMQGNDAFTQQTTGGLPTAFPHRPSEEEERLRQQIAAMTRLLDDWIQYTEEKWRTVSDSQLGWKPLRGRWGGWDDIFQDVYAAKTSDPMAEAAHAAGEATMRRFDSAREKGSAASAVACFLRDMLTLRRGIDMSQTSAGMSSETPAFQPVVQPDRNFGRSSGQLKNGAARSSLIRRPAQIFVDADVDK